MINVNIERELCLWRTIWIVCYLVRSLSSSFACDAGGRFWFGSKLGPAC